MIDRATILLAELYFNGGASPRYFATSTWYGYAPDNTGAPVIRQYLGRMVGSPTYSIRVGCVIWGDTPATGIGAIELGNVDGELNDLRELEAKDCLCVLKLVNEGDDYDDAVVVARAIMVGVEQTEETMRVVLRGLDTRLDRPLQPQLYDDTAPNANLEGSPVPILLGRCYLVEPADYDMNPRECILSDSIVAEVEAVYGGGSLANGPLESPAQWDYNTQQTGFVMDITVPTRITANAVGPTDSYTDLLGGIGRFYDLDNWTGGNPDGWTVLSNPPFSFVNYLGAAGAQFVWDVLNNARLQSGNVLPDTNAGWYMVVGRLSRITAGWLGIRFRDTGTLLQITEPGEFAIPVYVEAGANRTVRIGTPTAGSVGDFTLETLYLYKMDDVSIDDFLYHCLWQLLTRGGVTEESIDFSELVPSGLSWMLDPRVGYYTKSNTTARQAVNELMASVTGWAFVGPDGLVRIGTIHQPTGDPDLVVSSLNLTSYPVFTPDSAPNISDTYGAGRNWYPYTDQELAGITHTDRPPFQVDYRFKRKGVNGLNRFYRHGVGAEPIGTLLYDEADAQSESDRITDLYQDEHGFWTFNVALTSPQEAASLYPNAVIELDDPLFGDAAVKGVLISVEGEFRDPELRLTVWV